MFVIGEREREIQEHQVDCGGFAPCYFISVGSASPRMCFQARVGHQRNLSKFWKAEMKVVLLTL